MASRAPEHRIARLENPWAHIAATPPYVLLEDRLVLERHQLPEPYAIHLEVHPCPYVGDPRDAELYLLNLNPRFDETVTASYRNRAYVDQVARSLRLEARVPFWCLDPALTGMPGPRWWSRRLADLRTALGNEFLSRKLICLQYFPYHSREYKDLGARVPSQQHTFELLRAAIHARRPIIVMRARAQWLRAVPELATADLYELRSSRSAYLSRNNLVRFDQLVERLLAGATSRS